MKASSAHTSQEQFNFLSVSFDNLSLNDAQILAIGFFGTVAIYFLVLIIYMLKKNYKNFAEAFFLSISVGGAVFILSKKIYPLFIYTISNEMDLRSYLALLAIVFLYIACIPFMFKIIKKWNSGQMYAFRG